MTAVEMAFWRCTGQCIWIWPVCYYRYVKNEKHSDLFYKPSYVLTYALVSPMYTKLSNSYLNFSDNCGLCSNRILFTDITSHGRCCRKLFRNTNIDSCHINSIIRRVNRNKAPFNFWRPIFGRNFRILAKIFLFLVKC